ncbi:MAG: hypothetical protein HC930_01295 [Hydrococcus sp. SU_1_0]|nr:hypothetical protein [Hydrococcus sp. SU_1_0]
MSTQLSLFADERQEASSDTDRVSLLNLVATQKGKLYNGFSMVGNQSH